MLKSAMPPIRANKPRVFIDADVLFSGASSPSIHSASLVILRMAEITLIEAVASQQVIIEAERNLESKMPATLPAFRLIVARCLHMVRDPEPSELWPYEGLTDPKDLAILVAALRERCPWLVTFNTRDYLPGHPEITVLRPGEFLVHVRDRLSRLASKYPLS
jgi:predicted nucleic acid-binding protein